jgi:hypothetical protein
MKIVRGAAGYYVLKQSNLNKSSRAALQMYHKSNSENRGGGNNF